MTLDKQTLNPDQQAAFKAIKEFLKHPVINTFVLNGYAGTGKTYLMQYLAKWLTAKEQKFSMLAATGRAATVLKGKTGFSAKTVHSELYSFSQVNGIDEVAANVEKNNSNNQMSLQFKTRQPDENKMLYIVDEASMLSGELSPDFFLLHLGRVYC